MKRLRNAAWLSAARSITDILNAGLFVAVARHFGPQGVGEYAYAFAVAGFAMVFSGLGLDAYGVREFARRPAVERQGLLSQLLATQLAAILATAAGISVYLVATHAPRQTAALVVLLTIYQISGAVVQTLFVPAFAGEAMRLPAIAEMVCRGGAIVAAFLAITTGRAPLVLALSVFPVAGLLLVGVGLAFAIRHDGLPSLRVSWRTVRDTARLAWPFGASDIVVQLYARTDLVLLTLLAGQSAAGIYASGYKFVEVGAMPMVYLGLATYPALSTSFEGDRAGFQRLTSKLLADNLLVGGVLAWGLYFVVPEVIIPVLGQRFAGAEEVVRLMASLALISGAETALMRSLMAAHRQVARLRLLILGTSLKVVLNLALIPSFGVLGAVSASIVSLGTIDLLYLWLVGDIVPARALMKVGVRWACAVGAAIAAAALALRLGSAWWVAAAASLSLFLWAGGGGSRLVRAAARPVP